MNDAVATASPRRRLLASFGQWWLLTTALSFVLIAPRWPGIGRAASFEYGDPAVNALQIDDAKHGRELLGNYSRWGFHHPGPAFFYVYAAGELLLHDALGWVRSEAGAHIIAGILLQSAFFVAGLLVLARGLGLRWFLPLGLAVSLGVLLVSPYPFFSIWPPHVLLMPYFCLVAACGAMAAGYGGAVPLAMLAGCFLVHGHVAHPVLVGPMFVLAWIWLNWRSRAPGERLWTAAVRRFPAAHAVAAGILIVALVPLVIEASRGSQSNFARILEHVRTFAGDWREPLRSVFYLFSFAVNREIPFDDAPWPGWRVVAAGWPWLLLLALAFVLAGAMYRRVRQGRVSMSAGQRAFLHAWLGMIAVSIGLSYFWALTQSGGHESFNSFYFHAVVVHAFLLGVWAVAQALEFWPRRGFSGGLAGRRLRRWIAPAVTALALVQPWFRPPPAFDPSSLHEDEVVAALRGLLNSDLAGEAPKLLVFRHRDWPDAARVALFLKRSGVPFFVSPEWEFMFGENPAGLSVDERLLRDEIDPWWLARVGDPEVNGAYEALGSTVRLSRAWRTIDPNVGTRIDATAVAACLPYIASGLSTSDDGISWTAAPEVVLVAESKAPARSALSLEVKADPYLNPKYGISEQRGLLSCNGIAVGEFVLSKPGVARFLIPAEAWNRRTHVVLTFAFPDAHAPIEFGETGERRRLAWHITGITLAPAR